MQKFQAKGGVETPLVSIANTNGTLENGNSIVFANSAGVTNIIKSTSTELSIFSGAGADSMAIKSTFPNIPTGFRPYRVDTKGPRYVVCGYPTAMYTSDDQGTTWIKRTLPGTQNLYLSAIGYGPQGYIVGYSPASMYRSTDGITWTAFQINTLGTSIRSIEYVDGQYMVGAGGAIYMSVDGVVWTTSRYRADSVTSNSHNFVYKHDNMYYIGTNGTDAQGRLFKSSDRITWQLVTNDIPSTYDCYINMINIDGEFYLHVVKLNGNVGAIYKSTNLANWTMVTRFNDTTWMYSSVLRTGHFIVSLMNTREIHVSKDRGTTWTVLPTKTTYNYCYGLTETESNKYIVVGGDGNANVYEISITTSGVVASVLPGDGIVSTVLQSPRANSLTRKDYVDSQIKNINDIQKDLLLAETDSRYLKSTGGTLTGDIRIQRIAPILSFVETDTTPANKNWHFAADGGTFRLHEDNTTVTDATVVLMVNSAKNTEIRSPVARGTTQLDLINALTRKDYVDSKISDVVTKMEASNYLPLAGGKLTGTLTLDVPGISNLGPFSLRVPNGSIGELYSIAFKQSANNIQSGISFPKSSAPVGSTNSNDYDMVRAYDGHLLFNEKRAYGEWNKPLLMDLGLDMDRVFRNRASSGDLNKDILPGHYYIGNTALNRPVTTALFGHMTVSSAGLDGRDHWYQQTFYGHSAPFKIWTRRSVNGVFSPWKRIYTEDDPITAAELGISADGLNPDLYYMKNQVYSQAQVDTKFTQFNEKYDSNNDGVVDKAAVATIVQGAVEAGYPAFYGKDTNGVVGFHAFTPRTVDDTLNQQYIIDMAKPNVPVRINLESPAPLQNIIIQCFKAMQGIQNISDTLVNFSTSGTMMYYIESDNLAFTTTGGAIKTSHTFTTSNGPTTGTFISEEITAVDFQKITGIA